jgi:hypothetical protein
MDRCDEHHGRQVEAAKYLKVPLQTVSNWHGKRNWPPGEQVLRVQGFLAAQRRDRK